MAITNMEELIAAVHHPGGVYLQSKAGAPNIEEIIKGVLRELVVIHARLDAIEDDNLMGTLG